MPDVTINFPTAALLTRTINAICKNYHYQPMLPDTDGNLTIPNPETKALFTKRMLRQWFRDNIVAAEATEAATVARQTAINTASTDSEAINVP